jgi:retinol-binding protein 3
MTRINEMFLLIFAISIAASPCTLRAQTEQTVLSESIKKAVVESACSSIDKYYVFPEKAKVITDYLRNQNKANKFNSKLSPDAFANQIMKEIRSVHLDRHLRIQFEPELEADIIKFNSSKKGEGEILEKDVLKDKVKNFDFRKIEILPANVGYIEFTGFSKTNPEARKIVNAAMQFVANTDALIIDLRNNFGGDGKMAGEILSYFFPEKTRTGRSFNRLENKWADNYVENEKAVTNGLLLTMPIYILTSSRTFSAAEGFAYTLQSFNKATVVGAATRGGAHLTRSFSLGNGFVGFIPYLRGENAITNTDWEGKGVIPNIPVDEENCLLTAQTEILNKKLAGLSDGEERRQILWLINYFKSKTSKIDLSTSDMDKYIGKFSEFEISTNGQQLMLQDVKNHKSSSMLVPITKTLFQFQKDYQIEFLFDDKGLCNSIRMYWDDGWAEDTKRTR